MRLLYLDAFAGISGDMTLGALVDLGLPLQELQEAADLLGMEKVEVAARTVERQGIRAVQVEVRGGERGVVRTYGNIRATIEGSGLEDEVKRLSLEILRVLAEAEGRVHSRPADQVHFHELGAVDSIVDVVGCALGLHRLKVERVRCSALPTGRGWVRTGHGVYPVPPPAVAEILTGVPCYSGDAPTETVTPTGAAIVKACASEFGDMPEMTVEKVGYGAGTRELELPNLLRMFLGEAAEDADSRGRTAWLVETNIDDMNPEFYDHVMDLLFEAGASDAWLTPIQMKKTRPAVCLRALVSPEGLERVKETVLRETSALGLRVIRVAKEETQRDFITVETGWGEVRIKRGLLGGRVVNLAPEHDDCRRVARRAGVPIKQVYEAAVSEARRRLQEED